MTRAAPWSSASSLVALGTLVLVAVASPWPFGSVEAGARQILTGTALLGSVCALALAPRVSLPRPLAMALTAILGVVVLQLLPLPPALHHLLAPGSSRVWHPATPAAVEILGAGWRPVTVAPRWTWDAVSMALALLALALLAAPAFAARALARRATLVVVVGGVAVGLFGVATRTLFGPLLYGRYAVPTVHPYGPFVNKNHFAAYVMMASVLALGLGIALLDEERRRKGGDWMHGPAAARVIATFGLALAGSLCVVAALSRGSVLALVVGTAACVGGRWWVRRQRRGGGSAWIPMLAAAGLVMAAVAIVLVTLPEARERLATLGAASSDVSGRYRLVIWRDGLRMLPGSPLVGYGFGAFGFALPPFKTGFGEYFVSHAENVLVDGLVEGGLLGVVAWGAALVLVLRGCLRNVVRGRDATARGLGLGAVATVLALLTQDLFDFNLRVPSNATLFTFASALALGMGYVEDEPAAPPRPRGLGVLLAALLLSATGLVLGRGEPDLAPARDAAKRAYSTRGGSPALRLAQAEARLHAHVRDWPADAEAWVLVAWSRLARGDRAGAGALVEHARRLDPQGDYRMRAAAVLFGARPGP